MISNIAEDKSNNIKVLEFNVEEPPDVHHRKSFEPDENRGSWASKTEFILSCLGYAVGIGNVWRFPYLCYRSGGGAFLVPYLLMLILCGIPLFFLEIIIGQFSSTGCITMFRLAPLFKGTGYAIVVVNAICTIYYSVIISYPVLFFIKSLQTKLPWKDCSNPWNTPYCLTLSEVSTNITLYYNSSADEKPNFKTPADEFFHLEILNLSKGIEEPGNIVWPVFGCLLFSWIVVFICIIRGVKTVGKVVYFTATFPFFVLAVLFVRGMTLPGAMTGVKYYIYPDWDKLKDFRVWADAAIQIFFSLGPGWGGIVNMASYNNFRNNPRLDSLAIPIVNSGTSIFAGFVVFSVLGYLSAQTGIPVSQVATGGPGLAFVTYPEAIAMLPFPQLWAALFFIMLFLLGLDSVFVQIEAILSSLIDEFSVLRNYKIHVTSGSCLVMFLLAISMTTQGGMYFLQLFDWYSASISVILICLVEVFMVSWCYGVDNFIQDIYFMCGQKVNKIWVICWKYVTPIILLLIFLTTIIFNREVTFNNVVYPRWAIALGWLSCLVSIVCIPIYIGYKLYVMEGSFLMRLKRSLTSIDWYPASPEYRRDYELYVKRLTRKNTENQ